MSIEQTIKKAIEGGYESKVSEEWLIELPEYAKHQIWNDPSFWQSLGKALGWFGIHGTSITLCRNCGKESVSNTIGSCDYCGAHEWGNFQKAWLYHWHRFIDHLAESKSVESYFESL